MEEKKPFTIDYDSIPQYKVDYLARETLRIVKEAYADPVQREYLERRIRERKEREKHSKEE